MKTLPARIPGVYLVQDISCRRPDGSVVKLRPPSRQAGGAAINFREVIAATSGFTSQPSFARRVNSERSAACLHGEAYAIAIDVRLGSQTFMQWQAFYLCEGDARSLHVSHGIALGWQMTSTTAEIEIGYASPNRSIDWQWLSWDDEHIEACWPITPTTLAGQSKPSRMLEQIPDHALPKFDSVAVSVASRSSRRSSRTRTARKENNSTPPVRTPKNPPPSQKLRRESAPNPANKSPTRHRSGPILIIGCSGSLGKGLLKPLRQLGTVVGACRDPDLESLLPIPVRIDMARPATLREAIRVVRPSLIINTAAMGDVELAEANPRQAQLINAHAPAVLAEEAKKIGAGIIHFCSDMVFDGLGERPFRENDQPNPINQLARTRYRGTRAICASAAQHLVLRTGWLYSAWGDNYVKRILELSAYRDVITLPADHYGCPTSIEWLAATLTNMLMDAQGDYANWLQQYGGLYHASMLGYASRAQVADQIVAVCKSHGIPITVNRVQGTPLAELPSVTRIPANCRLDPAKFATTFGLSLPRWQDELRLQLAKMLGEKISAAQVA